MECSFRHATRHGRTSDPMTERPPRIQYLEGLRGIAAIQVVLLHFVTGFLPAMADRAPAPFPLLWDGNPRSTFSS